MIKHLQNKEDFNNYINEDKILVDFYADWCGPCRSMGEILEGIDDVNILKVNTDEFQDIAFKYGIMSIPTLILFEKGEIKKKMIGLQSKSDIKSLFN